MTDKPDLKTAPVVTAATATTETSVDLLAVARTKADALGIRYSAEDTVDAIRALVNAKLNAESAPPSADVRAASQRQQAILEATKLIRVRITNMDSRKADLPGEFFTVSNGVVGQLTRYIPYGEQEDGWHVEAMLLDMLKERQFYQLRVKKGANGQLIPNGRMVREFNIEILEPLTEQELKVLANKQAAADGMAT